MKNRMSSSCGGYSFISLVTWQRLRQPQLTWWHQRRQTCWVLRRVGWRSAYRPTATSNVLPPSNFRYDASPQLYCQVSIEEVRQVMTRSPVKVPLSTETVKGAVRKLDTLELRTPCEKFLATPLLDTTLAYPVKVKSCNYNHRYLLPNMADQMADEGVYF